MQPILPFYVPVLYSVQDFEFNDLATIPPGTFADVGHSLEFLIITHNRLTSLNSSYFYGLNNIHILSVEGNPITSIEPGALNGLPTLRDVRLLSSDRIRLQPDTFVGPSKIELLVVRDERVCCIAPESFGCITRELPDPLFTCRKTFLQNRTIKVFIWILGISALLGNGFVIVTRLRNKPSTVTGSVQSTLISNLAISDFLMGVYMLILAVMDMYIGEAYFWDGIGYEWRTSYPCQIAGFISLLSTQSSVFLLTLLSVDRFIAIQFPFSRKRLGIKSSRISVAIVWAMALILSVTSLLLTQLELGAYGLSDVCVGLPLIRKFSSVYSEIDAYTFSRFGQTTLNYLASGTASTWQFSIAIFLGVNLISFLVVLFCYAAIFVRVRLSREAVGQKNKVASEVKMALKMFFIVGTDLFCWMPIITMGILVQTDVITLSSNVYAWLVVFVLPINSSLNPFIYTIVERVTK
nr:G-protein coupled receptor GRL101-like [Lytechinus pictus]